MNTGVTFRNNVFSAFLHVKTIPLSMYSKSYLCYSKKYKKLVPFKLQKKPNRKLFETDKAIIFYVDRNENIYRKVREFKPKKTKLKVEEGIEDNILDHTGDRDKKFISISLRCDKETFDKIREYKRRGGYIHSESLIKAIIEDIKD